MNFRHPLVVPIVQFFAFLFAVSKIQIFPHTLSPCLLHCAHHKFPKLLQFLQVVNGLGSGTTLTGVATNEISDDRSNAFTPDGWAFSIW